MWMKAIAPMAALLFLAPFEARAQDAYAGKTLTLSTHTGPGGGYDTLIRL